MTRPTKFKKGKVCPKHPEGAGLRYETDGDCVLCKREPQAMGVDMQNSHLIFDEHDLEKIGIVCPDCATESIFDLGKDHTANQARECPGCGSALLERFTTEAKQNYNWITYYKRARDANKRAKVRLYLKTSRAGAE